MKTTTLPKKTQVEISNFIKWLRDENNLSECTVRNYYESMILFFREYDSFTKDNCKLYISDITAKGFSVQTCNLRISAFNKYMIFKKMDKYKLKGFVTQRTLHLENVPSEQQYKKLIEFLETHKNQDYKYWMKVLACTGARIGEFLQFTWEGIEKGNFIILGKGAKFRNFYIQENLSKEITLYKKKYNKTGAFAKNRFGKPITARGFSQELVFWGTKAGLPKEILHPHAFRHFFAKQYLKSSNGDIVQLSDFLGHSSLDMTRIYTMKSKQEQYNDFNKYVNW